jgi:predicted nucleic acid-binding protein
MGQHDYPQSARTAIARGRAVLATSLYSRNWQIVTPEAADLLVAVDIMERWQLSWWDALIVAMAQSVGAQILWTEDLNAGQTLGELTVRNPFRD